ncbi:MAG: glycosyltransferase family 2 protein [Gammaproteobacteria bacterium]|nr:glycosyltransferase family 2 protein [Gammaproteobacteria bacterium]
MLNEPKVLILMATYQGQSFLRKQIESIQNQTYTNWILLIRDDGSVDQTLSIAQDFQELDSRIKIIAPDLDKNLGPCQNFARLMHAALTIEAAYIMLADQDDVWDKDKIEFTLKNMLELELKYGGSAPLLVHTDLKVVDQDLKMLSPSFWDYVNLKPRTGKTFPRLFIQNVVTGCTAMFNRSLLNLSADIPKGVIMHDWWLALIASNFGQILSLERSTMAYRQHGNNFFGAKSSGTKSSRITRLRSAIKDTQTQSQVFLTRFDTMLIEPQRTIISFYSNAMHYNPVSRRLLTLKYGFRKSSFKKTLGLLLFL